MAAAIPVELQPLGYWFVVLPISRTPPMQEIPFPIHPLALAISKASVRANHAG